MTVRRALYAGTAGSLFAIAATPAAARVAAARPDGFELVIERPLRATPEAAWAKLIDIGGWWSAAHSYSGDAANLSLEAKAGGCFCERWGERSVEHARVIMAMPPATLRLSGGLGPLQALPVNAVMTFTVAKADKGAMVKLEYRVAGDGAGLDKLAGPVDAVLSEAMARLATALDGAR